jgi:hypothetical protein
MSQQNNEVVDGPNRDVCAIVQVKQKIKDDDGGANVIAYKLELWTGLSVGVRVEEQWTNKEEEK